MKKILLAFALLLSLTAVAQKPTLGNTSPKPLTLEKGKIYLDGEQLASYQVRKILATNVRSASLYKKAKTKEGLGGTLLGLGITLSAVDFAIGVFSDADYPTAMTYAGAGMVAVSIPILSGRAKKVREAVESYNDGLKNTSSLDFDLHAVANQNGVGIQIKF